MVHIKKLVQITILTTVLSSCTTTSHLALLSDGDLENKDLQNIMPGKMLKGEDCWYQHNLSDAFRDAIKGTEYDTLIDIDVTTKTNLLVFYSCVEVEGKGVKSSNLKEVGEKL